MRSILLTLLSFVLAWNVSAQSPRQPLPHTNHTQQDTKPDERGTEQVPLIIKVLPPLNEEEKSAAAKQERQDKSESDWWLVKLTGILAIIGVIQIVVFGLQAFRLRQTVDEMKIATQATEKAANAAEKSAEIARHNFIATHRPKIIVRRFSINGIGDDGDSVDIRYEMVNTGESLATVVRSSTKLWWHPSTESLPAIPPYTDHIVQSIPIENGMLVTLPSQRVEGFSFVSGFEEESGAATTGDHLLALGYIEYQDTIGKIRRTAFLRQYDFKAKRFDTVPHPDYEYQD